MAANNGISGIHQWRLAKAGSGGIGGNGGGGSQRERKAGGAKKKWHGEISGGIMASSAANGVYQPWHGISGENLGVIDGEQRQQAASSNKKRKASWRGGVMKISEMASWRHERNMASAAAYQRQEK